MKQDMILILDLGSEENPRLAREIRDLGVYSEIYPHDISPEELKALPGVRGIILNGGPNCIVDGVEIDAGDHVYNGPVPVLLAGVKGKHPWPAAKSLDGAGAFPSCCNSCPGWSPLPSPARAAPPAPTRSSQTFTCAAGSSPGRGPG